MLDCVKKKKRKFVNLDNLYNTKEQLLFVGINIYELLSIICLCEIDN